MFTTLPESNARRTRRLGGATVSVALHGVFIGLAVFATGYGSPTTSERDRARAVVFFPPTRDPTPSRPPSEDTPTRRGAPAPAPAAARDLIIASPAIPDVIPPSGPPTPDFDPRSIFPPRGSGGRPGDPGGDSTSVSETVHTVGTVERAVLALPSNQTPRYPAMLRSAGVEGSVVIQFVVDTLGRVEQGSARTLSTAHRLFEQAVREALASARFVPAEVGGRKVRQLVEQRFEFTIAR